MKDKDTQPIQAQDSAPQPTKKTAAQKKKWRTDCYNRALDMLVVQGPERLVALRRCPCLACPKGVFQETATHLPQEDITEDPDHSISLFCTVMGRTVIQNRPVWPLSYILHCDGYGDAMYDLFFPDKIPQIGDIPNDYHNAE